MNSNDNECVDCGADISSRGGNTKRCLSCAIIHERAYSLAYSQKPEGKAKRKAYAQSPEGKANRKARRRKTIISPKAWPQGFDK